MEKNTYVMVPVKGLYLDMKDKNVVLSTGDKVEIGPCQFDVRVEGSTYVLFPRPARSSKEV
jgi:hypothetical protein